MAFKITRVQRLSAVIGISLSFFVAEITVGFYTHSLALIADAFHYLNDLVGFIIALAAAIISEKHNPPKTLTYGWQRAQLLGAFFNGVLLFGLGISVFLQSIERFVSLQEIEKPKLVFIMGAIGFGLNIISILFLHDHDHGHNHSHDHHGVEHEVAPPENSDSVGLIDEKHLHHKHHESTTGPHGPKRDLAMTGVLIHILGDAGNNLGVMAAALVIWLAHYGGRFYADPAASMGIALMILASSIPLIKQAGLILLQSAPSGVDHDDVKHDLEKVPGVLAVHELHIWRLNQAKSLASVHVTLSDDDMSTFTTVAKTINECFHAYGIHSITLQPEVPTNLKSLSTVASESAMSETSRQSLAKTAKQCQVICGSLCQNLICCD